MFATRGSSGRFPNQYSGRAGPPGEGYPGGGPPNGAGPHGGYPGGGPPGPQGPAGPVRPIIVQTPQITLDTTTLENTFDTV